jgi:hypothetical protein
VEFKVENGEIIHKEFSSEEEMQDMFDLIEEKFGQNYMDCARITKFGVIQGGKGNE